MLVYEPISSSIIDDKVKLTKSYSSNPEHLFVASQNVADQYTKAMIKYNSNDMTSSVNQHPKFTNMPMLKLAESTDEMINR